MDHQWDFMSTSNLYYLSYIISTFLPLSLVQRTILKAKNSAWKFSRISNILYKDTSFRCLVTGSSAEGLYCPINFEVGHFCDLDTMTFSPLDFSVEDTIRPGYARLIPTLAQFMKKESIHYDADSQQMYLRRVEEVFDFPVDSAQSTLQGPSRKLLLSNGSAAVDVVYCFHYPLWPQLADGFVHRNRPAGWPPQELVEAIRREGCHFVPVAHPFSSNPSIEWRYSFSSAELKLAKTLSIWQRYVYIVVKMILKMAFRTNDNFKSYYLKTVFFWCCEKMPRERWSPAYHANCFFAIIDSLTMCLTKGQLSSYFIEDNNLISHLHESEIQPMIEILIDVRRDPVKHMSVLHQLNDNIYMDDRPYSSVMDKIISCLSTENDSRNDAAIDKQSTELMWDFISMGDPIGALEFFKTHQHFARERSFSFSHYLHLNILYVFQSHFLRVSRAFSAFRILNDLQLEMDNIEMTEQLQTKLEVALALGRDIDHSFLMSCSVYYIAFLYLKGKYEEAYTNANIFMISETVDNDQMILVNSAIALCAVMHDIREQYPYIESTLSELVTYLVVKSANKLNKRLDVQLVFNNYKRNSRMSSDCITYFLASSTFMDTNLYLAAIFEVLQCLAHCSSPPAFVRARHIYVCILLEILLLKPVLARTEIPLLRSIAKATVNLLKDNNGRDIREEYDLLANILRGLARIYRLFPRVGFTWAQNRCVLSYCLTSLCFYDFDQGIYHELVSYLDEVGSFEEIARGLEYPDEDRQRRLMAELRLISINQYVKSL